jgi:hypothetical protein
MSEPGFVGLGIKRIGTSRKSLLHQTLPTNSIATRGGDAARCFAERDVALTACFAGDEQPKRFEFFEDHKFLLFCDIHVLSGVRNGK